MSREGQRHQPARQAPPPRRLRAEPLLVADRQLIDPGLVRFLKGGDPGLDADSVLDSLEQSL
jgi:hypothetical protein